MFAGIDYWSASKLSKHSAIYGTKLRNDIYCWLTNRWLINIWIYIRLANNYK